MKVLSTSQIRDLDAYTIAHEPISSIDLMERAAASCTDWILEHFSTHNEAFIVCGAGNNGGDGLAIARLLSLQGWKVTVCHPISGQRSKDFQINLDRLTGDNSAIVHPLQDEASLPLVADGALIIDALFGSGLSRPLTDSFVLWAHQLNALSNIIISIDLPSGLFADEPTIGVAVHADFTLAFEMPKRAFFIPENQQYLGEWIILPFGLNAQRLNELETNWFVTLEGDVAPLLKTRDKFDHKGIFGHAMIVAGSYGKAGAAILACKAALRSGAGLVTAHLPGKLHSIMQSALPEVMVDTDDHLYHFTGIEDTERFSSIGIGCGIGVDDETVSGLRTFLKECDKPIVLDADALNCISLHGDMLAYVPANSILTPHLKEFERLFGTSVNHFDRLDKLRMASMTHGVYIVLKGAHTAIATPEGNLYFNTTGNPGMATAGSGDVLTGMITGLLAQGYSSFETCVLCVYLHGLAGDIAADELGYEALIASDIIEHLGDTFQLLHEIRMNSNQ